MRILVAGGAGYIGSNMTAMLSEAGYEAVVYDNLSRGHRTAVLGAEFVEGDLSDHKLLVETLTKYRIDAVMHFAALIEVGESVEVPLRYYRNNFSNTQVLLSAMEESGVDKFIFSSTAAVYGFPEEVPINESALVGPVNPYGQTKLAVERMCHWQSKAGRLRYAALRYFNGAGAGNNGQLGEDHRPESHLIPLVIAAAMGKRSDIKIYGTDYDTADGTCIRDYIHIEDLCSAHLLALEKLQQECELVYNLGNGKGYSVREVIDMVKKVTGKDFKVAEADRRAGDAPVLICDAGRAMKELGWQTKYPELEKIIETAWQWHNKYPDGYPD